MSDQNQQYMQDVPHIAIVPSTIPTTVNVPVVNQILKQLPHTPQIIPPEVVEHIMATNGATVQSTEALRLAELAACQFVYKILLEAKEHRQLLSNDPNESKILTNVDINYALHVQKEEPVPVNYFVEDKS